MNGQEYIVNLAEHVIGRSVIRELIKEFTSYEDGGYSVFFDLNPDEVFYTLYFSVKHEVKKMNSETLGRICSFALAEGADLSGYWKPNSEFIRSTTIADVHPQEFSSRMSGRELIEEIAVATIISVAFDIMNQAALNQERDWQPLSLTCQK
jgi:hypothetical protein